MKEKVGDCWRLTCDRCGYGWDIYRRKLPKSCARCKSKGWDEPRVYAGKYVSATICTRVKATGHNARRLKSKKFLDDYLAEIRRSSDETGESSD